LTLVASLQIVMFVPQKLLQRNTPTVEQVSAATRHAEAAMDFSGSVDSYDLEGNINVVGASAGKDQVCMSVKHFYCRSRPKIPQVTAIQPSTVSRKRRVNIPKRYQ